jgi:two-component system CheB/CheR fusion protein
VRVEQVLMNLLSNAIKFSPQDGTIDIAISEDDGHGCIMVRDTGQGIAPDFMAHVFDMFGQAGSVTTRSKGGLGIGLALVREIVQLHGGRVDAASEGLGKGARFCVWLPLYHDDGPACAGNDERADSGISGARILVVEDAADVVEVFQVLLELEGAEVVTATSAQEGLAVLEANQFDVVISDISMPGMDGYAFLEAARRMPQYAHLPAIALSGLAREVDIARARRAGYASHLTKPISVERLLATVHELLPH